MVDKAGIHIHVCADFFSIRAFELGNYLRSNTLNGLQKRQLFFVFSTFGKIVRERVADARTRIAFRVNRMSNAVDQTRFVERFLCQHALQVRSDFVLVFPVGNVFLQVFLHGIRL